MEKQKFFMDVLEKTRNARGMLIEKVMDKIRFMINSHAEIGLNIALVGPNYQLSDNGPYVQLDRNTCVKIFTSLKDEGFSIQNGVLPLDIVNTVNIQQYNITISWEQADPIADNNQVW